jgi:hypothetical protein
MAAGPEQLVVSEMPRPGVRVIRFARPDLLRQLDDAEDIAECSLYRAVHDAGLANLAPGEALVLNFGLVAWYPTAFHRLALKVAEAVRAHKARLLLCCLTPIVQEGFQLMGGHKVFEVRESESQATFEATK